MASPLFSSRPNLAQWAAARLLEAIERDQWREVLPGERVLSEQMGVSRPVLREALQLLEADGRIICQPNHPRRILKPARVRSPLRQRVLLLFGSDHQRVSDDPFLYSIVTALERKGIAAEVRPHGAVYALERSGFFKEPSITILLSVPRASQAWYAARGFPALISGAAYPGIEISSVDMDSRAVARHAVGNLLRLGHRRIACISAARPRAGDMDTEEGFLEAMAAHADASAEIVRPPVEPQALIRSLRSLFSRATPPSALLTCYASVAISVASYAARSGIQIPSELSIVCRDYSPFLQYHYPSIACYRSNQGAAIRQLIRWIEALPSRPIRKRLNAEFLSGDSIGAYH